MKKSSSGELPLIAILHIEIQAELKELIGQAADAENLPSNEYVARILARHLRRPELAIIPRKRMGRPRKHLTTK